MPKSQYLFAASDYTGAVTLWDTRASTVPLGRSEAHPTGKTLCLHWLQQQQEDEDNNLDISSSSSYSVLSGGSDCCIKITKKQ